MKPIPTNEDAEEILRALKDRGNWTSASASERDLLCPGSHLACVGLPEVTSDEAMSGTFIHAYLAGQALAPLSADEQEIADACQRRVDQFIGEWVFGKTYNTFREYRLWFTFEHNGTTYKHARQAQMEVKRHRALIGRWLRKRACFTLPWN